MTEPHVIVVGAGVGGLSAAFDLAHRGVRVTVLEQHDKPGGKMRQVQIGDHRVDSGPTVFTMRWIFEDLFADAGLVLDDHLQLQSSELLARHAWPDASRLDLFADVERSQSAIETFAGAEDADSYGRFAAESAEIFRTLDLSFMRDQRPSPMALAARVGVRGIPDLLGTKPFVTLWNDLAKRFRDPRLTQLFARYSTYCGSSPFRAPATLQLIAHAERAGVWYVEGGMQALANTISELITSAGGTIRCNAPVRQLLHYGNKVTGVTLADGEVVTGDAVIFNGDTAALANGLLGAPLAKAVPALPRDRRSLSAMTWSMVARVSGFPLTHHTVLFGSNYQAEFDAIFEQQRIADSPTVYLCAQDRHDEPLSSEHEERVFCLINAPARVLSEADLDRAQDAMLNQCALQGLVLEHAPTDCVRTTPRDFAQMFPATDGALYGRPTHGWMGSFSRPGARAKMKGLYLTGGSVHPGAGVPMVAMSGRLAAACLRYDLKLD